ncbi:endo-beta-1,4-glucanase [Hortaea werneckii]|nr:endo-beta-1,4-glucanase [Hortaea werneckii]KAI7094443.1 endo-beta-1,4-glucanase [Hortaea werneckii]KAI7231701.1 endo-beta-1,4-glucanase [Hortaea werneckii]KAI7329180.1 endo-beta-1,4-glucanase [Hortaea werneckii]KAI7377889.1 endo-beta-1,4-glucanase [Hortaea werneckii]
MHLTPLLYTSLALGTAFAVPVSDPSIDKRAGNFKFFGVNEAGPEFGNQNLPGVYNKDYVFPTLSTYDTFISKGFNTFRLNIQLERLSPNTIDGNLDATYLDMIKEQVDYVTGKGAYIMINPHNYGRYYGQIYRDTQAFGQFWAHVAQEFKSNSRVIFDTDNEFHDEPGQLVADLNQAAINAIRATGATSQYIAVEGNAYTGAWTWTTAKGTDGLTNAETMVDLKDPNDKILYEMHQYLDSDGSGTSTTCVSSTIGSERLKAATEWLRANGKKGLLGEYAGAVNPTCQAAVKDMLSYMVKNKDVWEGAVWWAAGPWWGDYMFSIEPTNGPAYNTYVPLIAQYA